MKIGDTDVFIRRNEAVSILKKVSDANEESFSTLVSSASTIRLADKHYRNR